MINALPTLYEIVSGKAKEKPSDCNPSRKRFKPSAQAGGSKSSSRSKREKGKERVSSDSDEACGACRGRESHKDWICCDFCNNWFHDVCVNITPDEAEKAATYECPYCSNPGKQAK
ncbi:PHD finger protein ALFIN-LIKE 5-like [Hibiscus syriacus]|uniref:PHD finger protein ALFIN-LIKE 5-like n=1 Tax=Hibiscus syriacus TaxID=106335 RepID=UPI0019222392|nr:PHD finger protein ALFIN-LIKE 5-like [Hibiscus syriacus]